MERKAKIKEGTKCRVFNLVDAKWKDCIIRKDLIGEIVKESYGVYTIKTESDTYTGIDYKDMEIIE